MITLLFKRAIEDIFKNRFQNLITIITISLSILIVSAFVLFFINTNEFMNIWKKGIRVMAYLKADVIPSEVSGLKHRIQNMDGVQSVQFISKQEALSKLSAQMKRQASIFENLSQNPLPDAFEIRMQPPQNNWENIESTAIALEAIDQIEEVEYGQAWLGRFSNIINLFRLVGYTLGSIFFMATVFIVANTIRLVIYSRSDEVEIMRLVGAADHFIKIPFYIQGIVQGALGGFLGLGVLFIAFQLLNTSVQTEYFSEFFQMRFLSPMMLAAIVGASMLMGWLGCYLSLKQYLKI
jgi:cell division transport system permease protein